MEKIKCLIVEPQRKPREIEIENTLSAKQKVVGGLIEMIRPGAHKSDDAVIICNEEGKLMGLPWNRPIRDDEGEMYDAVAGTFLIVRAPADSDEFASLTAKQMETYTEMYGREMFI